MFRSRSIVVVAALMLTGGYLAAQQPASPGAGAASQGAGGRATAGNVERGRYLVERVANCGECHSSRDAEGNIVQGTKFLGGLMVVVPSWSVDWPNRFPRIA